jgi:hypothetical protein
MLVLFHQLNSDKSTKNITTTYHMALKLTLEQYLRGTLTGHYPGQTGTNERELTEQEQRIFNYHREANFFIEGHPTDHTTRIQVFATSLTESHDNIVGVFQDKQGQIYAGKWNQDKSAFVGIILPVKGVDSIEVEYQSEVKAYPTGATSRDCGSWMDEGRLIFLSGGHPTRHISNSNASVYTWWKLHGEGFGWVQNSD